MLEQLHRNETCPYRTALIHSKHMLLLNGCILHADVICHCNVASDHTYLTATAVAAEMSIASGHTAAAAVPGVALRRRARHQR